MDKTALKENNLLRIIRNEKIESNVICWVHFVLKKTFYWTPFAELIKALFLPTRHLLHLSGWILCHFLWLLLLPSKYTVADVVSEKIPFSCHKRRARNPTWMRPGSWQEWRRWPTPSHPLVPGVTILTLPWSHRGQPKSNDCLPSRSCEHTRLGSLADVVWHILLGS